MDEMGRFSVENIFRNITFDQYKQVAECLESSIRQVNPNITSKLLLTTSRRDYFGWGSLTMMAPEVKKALDRREKLDLKDLNEDLWRKSYKVGLYIHDHTVSEPYMISLSTEFRNPKALIFYGQCLDKSSETVFESFKGKFSFKKIGDGDVKPSMFALVHALSRV